MMATHKISELSNTLARQDTTLAAQQGMLIATNQKLDFVLAALEAHEHKLRMSESMSDVSAMETDKTADGHRRSPEHNTEVPSPFPRYRYDLAKHANPHFLYSFQYQRYIPLWFKQAYKFAQFLNDSERADWLTLIPCNVDVLYKLTACSAFTFSYSCQRSLRHFAYLLQACLQDALQQIKMELARQQEMLAATNQRLGTLLESNDSVSSKKLLQLFEAELESKSQQTGR